MRRAAKVDANHAEIAKAVRGVGCSWQSLASVGNGCPDGIIGFRGANLLLEIKDGDKPPSKRVLTPDEATWHRDWRGQVAIIENLDQLFDLLRLVK